MDTWFIFSISVLYQRCAHSEILRSLVSSEGWCTFFYLHILLWLFVRLHIGRSMVECGEWLNVWQRLLNRRENHSHNVVYGKRNWMRSDSKLVWWWIGLKCDKWCRNWNWPEDLRFWSIGSELPTLTHVVFKRSDLQFCSVGYLIFKIHIIVCCNIAWTLYRLSTGNNNL